jgi:pyrroloquinoline quinone biosynthesis protein D
MTELPQPTAVSPGARPRFPRGVRLIDSAAHGGWVLLAPERMFKADAIAYEILSRCSGQATVAEIVDDLAGKFAAPRELILKDVTALIQGLVERRLMELQS